MCKSADVAGGGSTYSCTTPFSLLENICGYSLKGKAVRKRETIKADSSA
jgi:hypothetical protein